ncbi:MAG: LCP family protein [Bacilli bacterium]|nr:LCP family protein [Bacilli bacterium]
MKKLINFSNIVSLLSLIITTVLFFFMIHLDIIPVFYLIFLGLVIYGLNGLGTLFLKNKKRLWNIIGGILLLIISVISGVLIFYFIKTNHFFNQSFDNASNIYKTTYYIVAKENSSYKKIQDIENKTLNYYEGETYIEKATSFLDKVLSYNENNYSNIGLMLEDMNQNKIELILISKTSYDLVFNIDTSMEKKNYKIIYQFDIKNKMKIEKTKTKDIFNIYIGGRDFTNANMDFNMIITMNTKTQQVLLTSIPRDYYIEVDGYNKKDTLSYMGALGITTNMKSLEKFLDIPIDYYVSIDTLGLVSLVNELGGINYCSDFEYTTTHALILDSYDDTKGQKLHVKKGCQHINGIEALTIARERKSIQGGDRKRQENCQEILIDILEQMKGFKTLTNYNNILNSISDLYETTIPKSVIKKIIKDTIHNKGTWNVQKQVLDGEDTKDCVHMTSLIDWVMIPNMDTVNQAKEKIRQITRQ